MQLLLFMAAAANLVYFIGRIDIIGHSKIEELHSADCLANAFIYNLTSPKRIITHPDIIASSENIKMQTVNILANFLNITVEQNCKEDQYDCLWKSIYDEPEISPVLISWSSKSLQSLLKEQFNDAPVYSSNNSDLVWVYNTTSKIFSEHQQTCLNVQKTVLPNVTKISNDELLKNLTIVGDIGKLIAI
jgi:hypothetical protein